MQTTNETFHIPDILCYGVPISSLIGAILCLFIQSKLTEILFIPCGIGLLFGLVVITMGKPDKIKRSFFR